ENTFAWRQVSSGAHSGYTASRGGESATFTAMVDDDERSAESVAVATTLKVPLVGNAKVTLSPDSDTLGGAHWIWLSWASKQTLIGGLMGLSSISHEYVRGKPAGGDGSASNFTGSPSTTYPRGHLVRAWVAKG